MTLLEQVGGRERRDRDLEDLSVLYRLWAIISVAITHTENAVRYVERIAAWIICRGRVDINELRGEIRIGCIRRDPELDFHRADDGHIAFERLGLKAQHVMPGGERQARSLAAIELFRFYLIEAAAGEDRLA